MIKYKFNKPLKEGIIVRRRNRFIFEVLLDGEVVDAHSPTNGRIGDIVTENIACLVSDHSDNPERKTKFTVEAISTDKLSKKNKNWVGINQIFSNKLFKYFVEKGCFDKYLPTRNNIKPEVTIADSKLDFKIDNIYAEIKTPLTEIHTKYAPHIKTKKQTPLASTGRFYKQLSRMIKELKKNNEGALFVTVYQYVQTEVKPHIPSKNYKKMKSLFKRANTAGVNFLELDLKFTPTGAIFRGIREDHYGLKKSSKKEIV